MPVTYKEYSNENHIDFNNHIRELRDVAASYNDRHRSKRLSSAFNISGRSCPLINALNRIITESSWKRFADDMNDLIDDALISIICIWLIS